jgi:hypothetical protein
MVEAKATMNTTILRAQITVKMPAIADSSALKILIKLGTFL